MPPHHVHVQVPLLGTCVRAKRAKERLFSGMSSRMAEQIVLLNETSATHIAPIQNGGGGGGRGGNSPAPRATSTAFLRRKAGLVMGWFDWQHKGVGGEGGGGERISARGCISTRTGGVSKPFSLRFQKAIESWTSRRFI